MSVEIKLPLEELRKRKLFLATPMYGGNCAGMFTRSIADLSALCAHHGIVVKYYFLFNESLITRGRNYCVDEFMRSDCTHLMFVDADIGFDARDVIAMMAMMDPDHSKDDYDILAGPYPKKCLHGTTRVLTEDGKKTISWIVKNKYTGKVLSSDPKGNLSYQTILNHWSEPNEKKKRWVSLQSQAMSPSSKIFPRGDVILTEDHEVAYIDDMFDPVIKYTAACNMAGKYLVSVPKNRENPKSGRRHALLNKDQMSALLGIALGDGHVKDKGFTTGHGGKQRKYSEYIHSIIPGSNISILEKDSTSVRFTNGQSQWLADQIRSGKEKTLKNVVDYINEISLAFLYMDDGNRNFYPEVMPEETNEHSWWTNINTGENIRREESPGLGWKRGRKKEGEYRKPTSSIATMNFSQEDNQLLSDHIKNKFNITSEVRISKGRGIYSGRIYYYLYFDAENTEKMHRLIAPFVHESMNYKLNEEFRELPKKEWNLETRNISANRISSVNYLPDTETSQLYDVEVENNHNLFVNDGVLVHNCISWEKIKQAVDKGFADNNPNDLDKFVGDYVFNPASGSNTIPLNEPAEILEAGTGFMMIRRNTFEKFAEAYPQQYYKPDHVRTEHFDGSREIVAYFDTPIDHKRTNIEKELKAFLDKNPSANTSQIVDFVVDPNESMFGQYTKRYLSEDYMFCQWVRKIGLKIWLCPWMKLQHVGMFVFGGSLTDLAQIGSAATADINLLKKKK